MDHTRVRDAIFGDDYIPLEALTQNWAPQAGQNAINQPRMYQIASRLEHFFSRPVEHTSDCVREKTWPSSHTAAALSTSEMDVQMSDVGSEGCFILNTSAVSSTNQHTQTANNAGNPGRDGPQSSDLTILRLSRPLIPSAQAEGCEVSSTNISFPSISSHTKSVGMTAYNVSSIARTDTHPLSIQFPNEPTLNTLSSTHSAPHPQLHKAVVSDVIQVENIETKGQMWESSLQNQPSGPVATGVVGHHLSESLTRVPKQALNKDLGEVYRSNGSCIPVRASNNENVRRPNDTCLNAALQSDPKPILPERPMLSAPERHNERQYPLFGPTVRYPTSADSMRRPETFESHSTSQEALGTHLPFKLQHDLLTTIQVLIEETCFYFAKEWLPNVLKERGWDIPEQGELTSWWLMLKDQCVPPQAISFRGSEAKDVFFHCRKIRNMAVHRVRVSIPAIKLMMSDALDLIGGLNDEPRRAKVRKIQHCLQSRDLAALRLSIDEPLGEIGTYQDSILADGAGGQVGFIRHGGERTNANEKSGGAGKNGQSASQLGPPPTLSTTQIVCMLGTKNANSSLLSTLRDSGGRQATPSHTDPGNVTEEQTQADKYQEYKVTNESQSDLGYRLIRPSSGLDIYAQNKANVTTAKMDQNGAEGFKSEPHTNMVPDALPVRRLALDSNLVPKSNNSTFPPVVLKKGPTIIDLTGDNIIDLTQESDDESVVELGSAFRFSVQKPKDLAIVRRIIEPGARRAQKLRLRKDRKAKKLRAEQYGQAVKRGEKKGKPK